MPCYQCFATAALHGVASKGRTRWQILSVTGLAKTRKHTTDRQHVVSCINVEDLSELPEGHGAVVLPLEVCRGMGRGSLAAISWKQLLHLHGT